MQLIAQLRTTNEELAYLEKPWNCRYCAIRMFLFLSKIKIRIGAYITPATPTLTFFQFSIGLASENFIQIVAIFQLVAANRPFKVQTIIKIAVDNLIGPLKLKYKPFKAKVTCSLTI